MDETNIVTLIIAGFGFVSTLLAYILPKLIDNYYNEKKERKKRREDIIIQIKKLSIEAGKIASTIYNYILENSKIPEKYTITLVTKENEEKESHFLHPDSPLKFLLNKLDESSLKLTDLSSDAYTYSEAKDLQEKFYDLILELSEYQMLLEEKIRTQKIRQHDDLVQIKNKLEKVIKKIAEVGLIQL